MALLLERLLAVNGANDYDDRSEAFVEASAVTTERTKRESAACRGLAAAVGCSGTSS